MGLSVWFEHEKNLNISDFAFPLVRKHSLENQLLLAICAPEVPQKNKTRIKQGYLETVL